MFFWDRGKARSIGTSSNSRGIFFCLPLTQEARACIPHPQPPLPAGNMEGCRRPPGEPLDCIPLAVFSQETAVALKKPRTGNKEASRNDQSE